MFAICEITRQAKLRANDLNICFVIKHFIFLSKKKTRQIIYTELPNPRLLAKLRIWNSNVLSSNEAFVLELFLVGVIFNCVEPLRQYKSRFFRFAIELIISDFGFLPDCI